MQYCDPFNNVIQYMFIQWIYVWNKLLRNIVLSIRGFINLETQDSSIFNNNMSKKVMNHLQSTVMEMIRQSLIPEVYPQLIPIFHSSKLFLYPEIKAQFNLQVSRSWRKLQSNLCIMNILPGKCAWAPRKWCWKRYEMAGGFSLTQFWVFDSNISLFMKHTELCSRREEVWET